MQAQQSHWKQLTNQLYILYSLRDAKQILLCANLPLVPGVGVDGKPQVLLVLLLHATVCLYHNIDASVHATALSVLYAVLLCMRNSCMRMHS
jgi:hypothetical protein